MVGGYITAGFLSKCDFKACIEVQFNLMGHCFHCDLTGEQVKNKTKQKSSLCFSIKVFLFHREKKGGRVRIAF